MTTKNKFGVLFAGAVIFGMVLSVAGTPPISQAATAAKQDKHKPVVATDMEVIKKTTLRGNAFSAKKVRPAPDTKAATGVLGVEVTGAKYAIVIGIADYPGTSNDLKYTDDDARDMITALKKYGFDDVNIHPFIDEEEKGAVNATKANIIYAIQKIENVAGPNDEVVFFFSGHGGRGRANDGDKEAIDESIIVHDGVNLVHLWDGELKQLFDKFNTSRIVFIFDSCVAGGMTDLEAPGRIINMATTETGTAYEFDELKHGQFSYYFVDQGMIGGVADIYDHDGNKTLGEPGDVVIEEAFDYSKLNCLYQIPTISDLFTNDLLL